MRFTTFGSQLAFLAKFLEKYNISLKVFIMEILSKILKICSIFGLIFVLCVFEGCGYKQDPFWNSNDKKQNDVLFQ